MPRPIWKGSISFGLVNIPVQLELAVHEKSVRFHMMSKDGSCRLRRKLYCPETGKEFDFEDTARGIEVGKGEYVILDEDEIKSLRPEKGQSIEISQFIDQGELDPLYFDRAYFLTPTEASARPYKLLHEAMRKSGKVGLAQFVMRDREYLCAIRVLGEGLVLHTLDYADEVASIDESLPVAVERAKINPKEVGVAIQLIESMARPLDLSEFHDRYREQLEQLVERRKHGQKAKVAHEVVDEPVPHTGSLMDALRRSLRSPRAFASGDHGAAPSRPPSAERRRRAARAVTRRKASVDPLPKAR